MVGNVETLTVVLASEIDECNENETIYGHAIQQSSSPEKKTYVAQFFNHLQTHQNGIFLESAEGTDRDRNTLLACFLTSHNI